MLMVAKLLHSSHGFHITFVLTEYNYRRLLRSHGEEAVRGLPAFTFETIPDGLPSSDDDSTQHVPSLCDSTSKNCLAPFRCLLARLSSTPGRPLPPVSCIVADGIMSFTLDAAADLGIPAVLFWTTSACGYLAYNFYRPLLDHMTCDVESDRKEFLDARLDVLIPEATGLASGMRVKHLPSFIRRAVPDDDIAVKFAIRETSRAPMASAVILNTFDALEQAALVALRRILPSLPIYAIGPLPLLLRREIPTESPVGSIKTSLWKDDSSCLDWLHGRKPRSVVYVNFGSVTVMSNEQLVEFSWGLADSAYDFLWIIRPDLIRGESAVLPAEFLKETRERGMIGSWCDQEKLLMQVEVGVFLTHTGWNSTLESICGGVPMICWPFFAEQQTNCWYTCVEWGVGMEIDTDVKREEIRDVIRNVMAGDKGPQMRGKAAEWKEMAVKATQSGRESSVNFDKIVNELHYYQRNIGCA
ncbi:hypothetical protein HPP92_001951 [Vanilla planifolia]|uniref:Glycosyltransferase n=1 Tax=Vanilla planifolia TaxID=51239 RepID=A0A835VIH1_VANPL|nr:hypothetical protein HPP92_001951 [Vanilla planifolia]